MPELLSPAGSFEKMQFAFAYGADAVYAGAKNFSLREGAVNFSMEDLKRAIDYSHSLNKKLFLAANIFFHNRHLGPFTDFLADLEKIRPDGIILSDIGAVAFVREKYPELPVHISTQANTVNSASAKFYEKLGVNRIILARELALPEIREIRDTVSVELECFVHGAMCIAYSGRCLLSNYFTNPSIYRPGEKPEIVKREKIRDANLGDCAQSCRWEYEIVEKNRKNEGLPIIEEENGTAILSSKDLNLSLHMSELIQAGIDSFKIEGRMKSIHYAAAVTKAYRHAIDRAGAGKEPDADFIRELYQVSHRDYTTGFFFGENLALTPTETSRYMRDSLILGSVKKILPGKRALVRSLNQIKTGETMEVLIPVKKNTVIKNYSLLKDGITVEKVQPDNEFILEWQDNAELEEFAILRR